MTATMTTNRFLLLLVVALTLSTDAFSPIQSGRNTLMSRYMAEKKTEENAAVEADMNPLTRASWYAVEAFGNVFGSKEKAAAASQAATDLSKPPSSLQETFERIQLDNDRSYFLSGEVDKLIYDEDCVFADPFVSFKGRDRFVDNLANLGSFITKYSAKLLDYQVVDGSANEVKTKVMVKLELNLPWKPVLAWPWGVRYEIDADTNLITMHEESWDIAPLDGVKQIFRKPTTQIKDSSS
jgi:hypothetical protein